MMMGHLLELARRGGSLRVEGSDLRYRAPADAVTPELKDFLAAHKAALIHLLADPREAAQEASAATVEEVATLWNVVADEHRARGETSPWLGEGQDNRLQAEVGEAICAGDFFRALEAIAGWRQAWVELLEEPAGLGGSRPCPDVLIAESEGQAPPRNPGVHRMFSEACERFGPRAFEEGSLTAWLREHAPEVAALWPEAPVNASWFDWRRRVGPEQVEVLDRAWKEVTRQLGERGAK